MSIRRLALSCLMAERLRLEVPEGLGAPRADVGFVESGPCRDALQATQDPVNPAPLSQGPAPQNPCLRPADEASVRDANQVRVVARPTRAGGGGSHPSDSLARVMSGRRFWGSSSGRGFCEISLCEPESSMTISATSRTEYSMGLPIFTGRVSPLLISRITPSIRSSTYCRLLVWVPSP